MSGHTPGPWAYALHTSDAGERAKITTVAHCCDYVIGLPSEIPGGNYRDGDPSGDPEADARLIASAPDLLETLQELLAIDEWMVLVGGTEGPVPQEHIEQAARRRIPAIAAARAAIAAATGAAA